MLMLIANSYVEECNNILSAKTNLLMREYRKWLDISKLGFLIPMLSVILFLYGAKIEVKDKKMN